MTQLALPLSLDDHAVFDSFFAEGNQQLVGLLEGIASGGERRGCWIFGPAASGRTHLLQAICSRAGDEAVYLPMTVLGETGPALLEGLESRRIICIDDVDAVAGSDDWELALFNLFNALQSHAGVLVASAVAPPRESQIELPDLLSRMTQLPAFRLNPLADEQRGAALRLRAAHRGLDLPDETLRYLLTRTQRDMSSLYELLDRLDKEALRAQRRLTVPFVRSVIGQ